MNKDFYAGRKLKGTHTTTTPFALEVIRFAEKLDIVKGISLAIINPKARSKKAKLIIKRLPAGLEVKAYGSTSMQVLVFFTSSHEDLQTKLEEAFA